MKKERDNKGRFIKGHKLNIGKNNGMYNKSAWNKNLHKKFNNALDKWHKNGGQVWNKETKGIHLSPKTEFKKGHIPWNKNKEYQQIKGKNHWNWKNGLSKQKYPYLFNKELKEKIKIRDNYECQNCGMTEEEHIIVYGFTLEIHHIDYNKKNCKENNLISLCLGCNIRANYNRDYWKEYYKCRIIKK